MRVLLLRVATASCELEVSSDADILYARLVAYGANLERNRTYLLWPAGCPVWGWAKTVGRASNALAGIGRSGDRGCGGPREAMTHLLDEAQKAGFGLPRSKELDSVIWDPWRVFLALRVMST